jgi:AraC-like DNA-binding protein
MDSSSNAAVGYSPSSVATLPRSNASVSALCDTNRNLETNHFEASLWKIILRASVVQSPTEDQKLYSPFSCRLALTNRLQLAKLSFESTTTFIRTSEHTSRQDTHCTVIAIPASGGCIENQECSQTFSGPSVIILAPGTPFSLELSAPWEVANTLIWMSIPVSDLQTACLADPDKPLLVLPLQSYDSIDFYSEALIKKNLISEEGIGCAITSILSLLREDLSDSKNSKSSSIKMYNSILEYVGLNYADRNLNADTLAKKFNMSKRKLYKLFESLGVSVHDKIIEARLDAAYMALTSPKRQKIINIAYDAGFNDVSTFYRQFRKRFGRPPKAQM